MCGLNVHCYLESPIRRTGALTHFQGSTHKDTPQRRTDGQTTLHRSRSQLVRKFQFKFLTDILQFFSPPISISFNQLFTFQVDKELQLLISEVMERENASKKISVWFKGKFNVNLRNLPTYDELKIQPAAHKKS